MTRRPRKVVQYSFEGGEADPQYKRRADADLWMVTAERLRNVRLTNGGGFRRRPGLARLASTGGAVRFFPFVSRDGAVRMLACRHQALDVYKSDGTLEATLTSAPWGAADLATLQFASENDRVILTHRSFWPQELLWNGAAFTRDDLAFLDRYDGSFGQPYWRFRETRGISITPSALTGASIDLVADDPVFVAGHVGLRFRILGREVEIKSVTDAENAVAEVIQPLRPTYNITVDSSAGFSVGDQVMTSVDDLPMEVVLIADATHVHATLTDIFGVPTTTDNKLMGPNASANIAGVNNATPGATVQWEEPLISAVRGYPGGCCFHKGRLLILDFPGAPELHAFSVLREPGDFDTGDAEDDDAILDGPGDATGRRARYCVSSEQLISLTEVGSYYVGEGPNTPVTPTTAEFLRISPEPAGDCNPILAAEGVVFPDAVSSRLIVLAPSGQLRRAWTAGEVLAIASELLRDPIRLVMVDGSDWGPERYLLAINADGTICAVHYRRDSELAGASLWSTVGGQFLDVAMCAGKVWACVKRGDAHSVERFDPDRLLDNSVVFTNGAAVTPTHSALANRTVALVWRETTEGEARRADIGEFAGDGGGALLSAPTAARTYEAGGRFPVLVRMWPPIDPEAGPSTWQRVSGASIDVLRSGIFYAMGQRFTPFRAGDDVGALPPLRSGWRKRRFLGRMRDFPFEVSQAEAAPLEIRAITLETN